MIDNRPPTLRVVDAFELSDNYRSLLRPGETFADREGKVRRLPRFFYEVDTWQTALDVRLTSNFGLWEFINIDLREAEPLRIFPRYVPCAVALTAAYLQLFREKVGAPVRIAANGGYRSPAHSLSTHASPHNWATGVNVYRVGNDYMDVKENVERYAQVATSVAQSVWARPFGYSPGFTMDHLHVDLGYVTVAPHGFSEE
jgi:hypothetical protein